MRARRSAPYSTWTKDQYPLLSFAGTFLRMLKGAIAARARGPARGSHDTRHRNGLIEAAPVRRVKPYVEIHFRARRLRRAVAATVQR